jgi:hypothetical protein
VHVAPTQMHLRPSSRERSQLRIPKGEARDRDGRRHAQSESGSYLPSLSLGKVLSYSRIILPGEPRQAAKEAASGAHGRRPLS